MTMFRTAETEKYPHVTYFFNGGLETPFAGEVRNLVASPKVATYDLQPEMSAAGVTDVLVDSVAREHDVIICRFPDPGHGRAHGVLEAAIAGHQGRRRLPQVAASTRCSPRGAGAHDGRPRRCPSRCRTTARRATHPPARPTLVPVEYYIQRDITGKTLRDGALTDVAPTLLRLLGLPQPVEVSRKIVDQPGGASRLGLGPRAFSLQAAGKAVCPTSGRQGRLDDLQRAPSHLAGLLRGRIPAIQSDQGIVGRCRSSQHDGGIGQARQRHLPALLLVHVANPVFTSFHPQVVPHLTRSRTSRLPHDDQRPRRRPWPRPALGKAIPPSSTLIPFGARAEALHAGSTGRARSADRSVRSSARPAVPVEEASRGSLTESGRV